MCRQAGALGKTLLERGEISLGGMKCVARYLEPGDPVPGAHFQGDGAAISTGKEKLYTLPPTIFLGHAF